MSVYIWWVSFAKVLGPAQWSLVINGSSSTRKGRYGIYSLFCFLPPSQNSEANWRGMVLSYVYMRYCFFFFLVFLECNSHIIKFTLLNCRIQWDLICWVLLSISKIFSAPPKETPYQFGVIPRSFLSPRPWQPITKFLFLWIFFFWILHINVIM